MLIAVSYPSKYYFGGTVDVEAVLRKASSKYKGRNVGSGVGFWPGATRDNDFQFSAKNARRFVRSIRRLKALQGKKLEVYTVR